MLNRAIASCTGENVLTLNPDVVLTPTVAERGVEAIESAPNIGAVNCKLLRVSPGSFDKHRFTVPAGELPTDSAGLLMFRTRRQVLRGYLHTSSSGFHERARIFGPDGAAVLYRREMLEEVRIEGQYFDETFFAHKADLDLAWRARLLGRRKPESEDEMEVVTKGCWTKRAANSADEKREILPR